MPLAAHNLRPSLVRLLLYLLLAAALRWVLFQPFPLLLTNDSPDYIGAATDIATRLDFGSDWLRDWRTPGYPVFLATILPLTGLRSDLLVLAQSVLGMATIPLGYAVGRLLRTQLVAEALAIFIGFNPAYLLNEHALMTETLSLAVLLVFTALILLSLQRRPQGLLCFGVAVTCGACLLVRVNFLPYCAVLSAAAALHWLRGTWPPSWRAVRTVLTTAFLPFLAGLALLLGPWLWRNYTEYQTFSLSNHTSRNLLIWKAMSNTLDYSLPLTQQELRDHTAITYAWVEDLNGRYPTNQAEAIARTIWNEQVQADPARHLRAIVRSALNFGGIYVEGFIPGDDRAMQAWWFRYLVPAPAEMLKHAPWATSVLTYVGVEEPSIWTSLWSRWGDVYLHRFRPLLLAAMLGATAAMGILLARRTLHPDELFTRTYGTLLLGWYATMAFHATTLTSSDRYALIFDWVALAVVLGVAQRLAQRPTPRHP